MVFLVSCPVLTNYNMRYKYQIRTIDPESMHLRLLASLASLFWYYWSLRFICFIDRHLLIDPSFLYWNFKEMMVISLLSAIWQVHSLEHTTEELKDRCQRLLKGCKKFMWALHILYLVYISFIWLSRLPPRFVWSRYVLVYSWSSLVQGFLLHGAKDWPLLWLVSCCSRVWLPEKSPRRRSKTFEGLDCSHPLQPLLQFGSGL